MNINVHPSRSPKAPALDLPARGLGRARPRQRSTATTTSRRWNASSGQCRV